MGAFNDAWVFLKATEEKPLGYTAPDYDTETDTAAAEAGGNPGAFPSDEGDIQRTGESSPPGWQDAYDHFFSGEHMPVGNNFYKRREEMSNEVSQHLRDVFNSYKDGHPDWENPTTDKEGPPGTTELSALIEDMAKTFGAQVPW